MTDEAILGILDSLCNEARNSMHAVFGLLELPAEAIPDARWQSSVEAGRASADRLLHAIDDVRELLASPLAESAATEEFDLADCLRTTVELLNLAGVEDGAPVCLGAPPGVVLVRQNRRGIEQVLMRLVSAARKMGGAGSVRIEGTASADGIRLSIAAGHIEAARRLCGWLNADPGQACFPNPCEVPLAVAVMAAGKCMRSMGGVAEMEAVPTRFSVNLPMAPVTASPPRHTLRAESLNVLMAEDCDESFALGELLLRNENVWRARSGLEAFELVRKQRFDVVFMDVHMPGIDGYTAIRTIRDWETETGNARTPVVVLSSDDLETQRSRAAQSGCSGFMRKPLRNGELVGLLDRLKAARLLTA